MNLQHQSTNNTKTLAAQLGAILADKQMMITTAESCTGGGIAYAITDTPGSSRYFAEAMVTYSNGAKHERLGVSKQTLADYGAVSEQTVREMAIGAAQAAEADVAVVTSGIAGPDGGSDDKPVGLVWFAVFFNQQVSVQQQVFTGDRAYVREQAIAHALAMTVKIIESA
ncbi:damage-inducible protein CinA [Pseudoalteromonas ruthenica]|uniref:CinA family protein n=1 Tax=Pseudoalteromonas ruthenica TaxID=151081 RepID=UPI001107FB03|nr:CinA family protein [Pseudoalteromonas ruthenica]TLX50742.1 damage-inducible protein CinA [Pseudoalteromonas ruthenica]